MTSITVPTCAIRVRVLPLRDVFSSRWNVSDSRAQPWRTASALLKTPAASSAAIFR